MKRKTCVTAPRNQAPLKKYFELGHFQNHAKQILHSRPGLIMRRRGLSFFPSPSFIFSIFFIVFYLFLFFSSNPDDPRGGAFRKLHNAIHNVQENFRGTHLKGTSWTTWYFLGYFPSGLVSRKLQAKRNKSSRKLLTCLSKIHCGKASLKRNLQIFERTQTEKYSCKYFQTIK